MRDRARLVTLVTLVVTIAVLSIGTATTVTSGEPDPEELLAQTVGAMETEPIEAIQTKEIVRPDETTKETRAVYEHPPHAGYLKVLDATDHDQHQQVAFNESIGWRYDGSTGTTIKDETLSRVWFDELQTIGVPPDEVLEHYQVEYSGTETVDGEEVYRLDLTPPEETTASLSVGINAGSTEYEVSLHEATEEVWYLTQETWWIDTELTYPVKQEVEWTDEDGNVMATATKSYEELRIGSDVDTDADDEIFEFDSTGRYIVSDLRTDATIPRDSTRDEFELNSSATDRMQFNMSSHPGLALNGSQPSAASLDESNRANSQANGTSVLDNPVNESSSPARGSGELHRFEPAVVDSQVFRTYYSADAVVPFDLSTLGPPAGHELRNAIVKTYEREYQVRLAYKDTNSDATVSVLVTENDSSLLRPQGSVIHEKRLSEFDGDLVVTGNGPELLRQCDELTYRVRGPPEAKTLVEFATSLECPKSS